MHKTIITADMNQSFVSLTGDRNWIHNSKLVANKKSKRPLNCVNSGLFEIMFAINSTNLCDYNGVSCHFGKFVGVGNTLNFSRAGDNLCAIVNENSEDILRSGDQRTSLLKYSNIDSVNSSLYAPIKICSSGDYLKQFKELTEIKSDYAPMLFAFSQFPRAIFNCIDNYKLEVENFFGDKKVPFFTSLDCDFVNFPKEGEFNVFLEFSKVNERAYLIKASYFQGSDLILNVHSEISSMKPNVLSNSRTTIPQKFN